LVEGLYLIGSVALGDFRPEANDVDCIAMTAARLDTTGIAASARVHSRLRAHWLRPSSTARM
jgi:hypothetical protein